MPRPSSWRGTLALIVLAIFAAQLLLKTIAPILPWLVLGLVAVAVIAVVGYLILRRSTRW